MWKRESNASVKRKRKKGKNYKESFNFMAHKYLDFY